MVLTEEVIMKQCKKIMKNNPFEKQKKRENTKR